MIEMLVGTKKRFSKISALIIAILMLISSISATALAAPTDTTTAKQFTDIKGHWAEKEINDWISKGLIAGYEDNTFRPDNPVTRAEFVTFTNRSNNLTKTADINFKDVKSTDWFYNEIQKAKAANIVSGYDDNTFRPNNSITREEAAAILTRLLKLQPVTQDALKGFKDASQVSDWAKDAVNTAVYYGLIKGYPDNTVGPDNPITRAETVVILNRALNLEQTPAPTSTIYDKAGTYGPQTGMNTINGDVTISAADVTLQNTTIKGNLLISKAVGDGNVTLKNVIIEGTTTINGGGEHSIVLEDCTLAQIIVNKDDGKIRLVAKGATKADSVTLQSGAKLEEDNITGKGFANISIEGTIPANVQITLTGNYDNVKVNAPGVSVEIASGTVNNLTVSDTAKDSKINIADGAKVSTLTANAAAAITGKGTIETASINANNVTIEQKPINTNIASGITAVIGGQATTSSTSSNTVGGGGGGSSSTSAPTSTITPGVDYNEAYILANKTRDFTFNIKPSDAILTAISDNTNIATLTVNGNIVTVKGITEGTANITVVAHKDGYTDAKYTFKVIVGNPIYAKNLTYLTFLFKNLGVNQHIYHMILPKGSSAPSISDVIKTGSYNIIDVSKGYNYEMVTTWWEKPLLQPGTEYDVYFVITDFNGNVKSELISFNAKTLDYQWQPINTGLPTGIEVNYLAVNPNTGTVYAAVYDSVYQTTDGATWSSVGTGLPTGEGINYLAVNSNTGTVYAAVYDSVYQKTTDGTTWSSVGTGLPTGIEVNYLAVNSNTGTVYAAVYDSVYQITNGGTTWSSVGTGLPTGQGVNCLAVNPNTGTVYAAVYDSVYQTTNGTTWININVDGYPSIPPGLKISSLAVEPIDEIDVIANNTLYCLLKNTNCIEPILPNGVNSYSLAINPFGGGYYEIILGTSDGVYVLSDPVWDYAKITNNGAPTGTVSYLVINPKTGTVYAIVSGNIYKAVPIY
ncbi:S-layer homology domain-containing protein [Aceticella autotrophica]|uniref:S-layer homology domain-containing protein n=1 Tax=Aceticella autotrophica TaxID=2755338 RepID=A0A975GAP5_9THEO|nr:S-layer homology domain-containing protein [Aceticella autotrophica]QSZ27623.1 S-layer homology domain-containing protein [Aceticella autotrophica]